MSALEKLFGSAVLQVAVPEAPRIEPPDDVTLLDEWLAEVASQPLERSVAFHDERLELLLLSRIPSSSENDTDHPPKDLLALLAHVQISLEASYISPESSSHVPPPTTPTSFTPIASPPRSDSLHVPGSARNSRPSSALGGPRHHPSIIPPSTPNPTPFASDQDRRYLNAEGTPLSVSFWGQEDANKAREAFWLRWSPKEKTWVAVYRLVLTVSFLRLPFGDPLLCLTVSTTLREQPLNIVRYPNHPIAAFLAARSFDPASYASPEDQPPSASLPVTPGININGQPTTPVRTLGRDALDGLEEVNLLEGLAASPSFHSDDVQLLSTRLGTITRKKQFLLPFMEPGSPAHASPRPSSAVRSAPSTMKKSYRKVLTVVAGFSVRMRTTFVPAFIFRKDSYQSPSGGDGEEMLDAAGNDERTVVLCVELENSGEAGPDISFQIEKIDVKVQSSSSKAKETSGTSKVVEAEACLVGWGDGLHSADEVDIFPLRVGANEQYNLLYVVSFLRNTAETGSSLGGPDKQAELHRAVALEIFCRPTPSLGESEANFPTAVYSSKWSCTLDLSSASQQLQPVNAEFAPFHKQVLPEPASPFPGASVMSPRSVALPPSSTAHMSLPARKDSLPPTPADPVTPEKRHTMPTVAARAMGLKPAPLRPSSIVTQNRLSEPPHQLNTRPSTILPPSVSAALSAPRSPTTYGPPSPIVSPQRSRTQSPAPLNILTDTLTNEMGQPPPVTPAYPAYPSDSPLSQRPPSTGPAIGGSLSAFKSLPPANAQATEIRRERGTGLNGPFGSGTGKVPQTPAPVVAASGESWASQSTFDLTADNRRGSFPNGNGWPQSPSTENQTIVSISLLPMADHLGSGQTRGKSPLIKPFDEFMLDIFVYNQSVRVRRFEIGCSLGERRHHVALRRARASNAQSTSQKEIGIIPLDNRVRVGPLQSGTCQSVRMKFMALSSGIHSIDSMTITDTESGYIVSLQSVMDIVVH